MAVWAAEANGHRGTVKVSLNHTGKIIHLQHAGPRIRWSQNFWNKSGPRETGEASSEAKIQKLKITYTCGCRLLVAPVLPKSAQ